MSYKLNSKLNQAFSESIKISDAHMQNTKNVIQAAYSNMRSKKQISFWNFLFRQIKFVGVNVWISQIFALFIVYFMLNAFPEGNAVVLCASAILIIMAGLPMWARAKKHRMQELELSTKMSTRWLLLAKIIITGASNLIAFAIILLFAKDIVDTSVLNISLYLLLPYLLACCFCVPILERIRSDLSIWICGVFCLCLVALFYVLFKEIPEFYMLDKTWLWQIICVALSAILVFEVFYQIKTFRACPKTTYYL